MLPLELGLLNQAQRWRLKTADAVIYRALLPYVTTSHSHTLDANHFTLYFEYGPSLAPFQEFS